MVDRCVGTGNIDVCNSDTPVGVGVGILHPSRALTNPHHIRGHSIDSTSRPAANESKKVVIIIVVKMSCHHTPSLSVLELITSSASSHIVQP